MPAVLVPVTVKTRAVSMPSSVVVLPSVIVAIVVCTTVIMERSRLIASTRVLAPTVKVGVSNIVGGLQRVVPPANICRVMGRSGVESRPYARSHGGGKGQCQGERIGILFHEINMGRGNALSPWGVHPEAVIARSLRLLKAQIGACDHKLHSHNNGHTGPTHFHDGALNRSPSIRPNCLSMWDGSPLIS